MFIKDGWTPVHLAAQRRQTEPLALLIAAGAVVNVGSTVLLFLFIYVLNYFFKINREEI